MQNRQEDAQLIDRLKSGDPSAVSDLERLYKTKIQQLARRYVRNAEDVEEVVQDVLLRVHQRVDRFRGEAALSSWIYRITFNVAMSRLRSPRYRRPFEVGHANLSDADRGQAAIRERDLPDWSLLADDALHRAELRTRLVEALGQLPEIYRTPVLLRDVQGLSTAEASALLQVKPETLKSRLHRGRLRLREQLAEFASGLALRNPAA